MAGLMGDARTGEAGDRAGKIESMTSFHGEDELRVGFGFVSSGLLNRTVGDLLLPAWPPRTSSPVVVSCRGESFVVVVGGSLVATVMVGVGVVKWA